MEYRRLGRSGLKVSTICLGTMQFGWTTDEQNARQVMARAVELGCNFFDTADVYSRWAEGNEGGVSEQIIGRWLAQGQVRRQDVIIATKVRGAMGEGLGITPGAIAGAATYPGAGGRPGDPGKGP